MGHIAFLCWLVHINGGKNICSMSWPELVRCCAYQTLAELGLINYIGERTVDLIEVLFHCMLFSMQIFCL